MVRFTSFESLGLSLAAMTEAADGDFAWPNGREQGEALAIAKIASRVAATVRQVHGTRVAVVESGNVRADPAEADAIITRETQVAIGVRVADCVPLFLFCPRTPAIGIVHAGRRGTFENIAAATVQAMSGRFHVDPDELHAFIGPSAGPCCYEVDQATAHEFQARGYPVRGRNVDLWRTNAEQLIAEGLAPEKIAVAGECTICSSRFHSYRATGTVARNIAVLAL